jgi:hypothetical protein
MSIPRSSLGTQTTCSAPLDRTVLSHPFVKMHFSALPLLVTIATLTSTTVAAPKAKPPAFFLAGDSTTAVQSAGGGGTLSTILRRKTTDNLQAGATASLTQRSRTAQQARTSATMAQQPSPSALAATGTTFSRPRNLLRRSTTPM